MVILSRWTGDGCFLLMPGCLFSLLVFNLFFLNICLENDYTMCYEVWGSGKHVYLVVAGAVGDGEGDLIC